MRAAADFGALLDAMDYGDRCGLSDAELREMCLLSLQDLEPAEAAELVLTHDLDERLTKGQITNYAHEMSDERLWEEAADIDLHEGMFHVASLLYAAMPAAFPEPDAVRVQLEVVAANDVSREALTEVPSASFVLRLLADGMEPDAPLHRLFQDQLTGTSFPEADDIAWIIRSGDLDGSTRTLDVTSSSYWFGGLEDVENYESKAYADEADDDS